MMKKIYSPMLKDVAFLEEGVDLFFEATEKIETSLKEAWRVVSAKLEN